MPEIMDGKNVADFYSLDIRERLEELEREERRMLEEGAYEEEGMVSFFFVSFIRFLGLLSLLNLNFDVRFFWGSFFFV